MTWCLAIPLTFYCHGALAEFHHDSDVSLRLDDASNRDLRSQYRLRFKPSFTLNPEWSLNGFVSTGDLFPSAYNTFDHSNDDLQVRHLFARYATGPHKVEFGVIPPYKGRVSSTGLSKEGWIKGARGVLGGERGALELVVGDLGSIRASGAVSSEFELNYVELEYSGRVSTSLSFELSAERMLDSSFVRSEIRHEGATGVIWSGEMIHNATAHDSKFVVSALIEPRSTRGQFEWFAYYAYTGIGFGRRAILTEDFLSFGHALGIELERKFLGVERATWFLEAEVSEVRSRIKLGIQYRLGH